MRLVWISLEVHQWTSDADSVQLTQEYTGRWLIVVETGTGLLQLLSATAISGRRHTPMKCTDLGGPSLNRHSGASSRNGSISKLSISNRCILSTFSFVFAGLWAKVVAIRNAGRRREVAVTFENLRRMRMTSSWARCCIIIRVMMTS